jgi:peptide-methionine (R)-S-oxide reductase
MMTHRQQGNSMRHTLPLLLGLLFLPGCHPSPAPAEGTTMPQPAVQHTGAQWKQLLTPEQYRVLRQKATDRPFTGQYDNFYKEGTYSCAACGAELFTSDTKFNAGCGWPSFFAAKAADRVRLVPDYSAGMLRTEVLCARCGSHLGHLFDDAPKTPTGQRFCINSTSLTFTPATPSTPSTTQPSTRPAP